MHISVPVNSPLVDELLKSTSAAVTTLVGFKIFGYRGRRIRRATRPTYFLCVKSPRLEENLKTPVLKSSTLQI